MTKDLAAFLSRFDAIVSRLEDVAPKNPRNSAKVSGFRSHASFNSVDTSVRKVGDRFQVRFGVGKRCEKIMSVIRNHNEDAIKVKEILIAMPGYKRSDINAALQKLYYAGVLDRPHHSYYSLSRSAKKAA